ncbi:MAG: PEP-CTERM sorting domain-containing protein [Planctomycetota bacterium]
MPARIVSVLLMLMLGFLCNHARGEIMLTVGNGTITPDGSLSVDVLISSSSGPLDLADYSLELEIVASDLNSGTDELIFTLPQSESFLLDDDYVFRENGEAKDDPLGGVVAFQTDTIIQFLDLNSNDDSDLINVSITATPQLLARVELDHNLFDGETAASSIGNQYTITVVEDNTEFFDADGFDTFEPTSGPFFTATGGMITVGAAAIPEPGSMAVLVMLTAGVCVRRRRRV